MSDPPAPSEPAIAPGGDHPAPAPLTPDAVATILADFQAWLQEGNWNTGSTGEAPLPAASMLPLPHGVDLFTLVGQFTALRHEVNLQTKAARTAVEQNARPCAYSLRVRSRPRRSRRRTTKPCAR